MWACVSEVNLTNSSRRILWFRSSSCWHTLEQDHADLQVAHSVALGALQTVHLGAILTSSEEIPVVDLVVASAFDAITILSAEPKI